jgi:hypothetical protein
MRPKPLPAFAGISYWHAAYRLYTRLPVRGRPPIEGLTFLRSDCDSRLIAAAGNLLTDFRLSVAPILVHETASESAIEVQSPDAPGRATIDRHSPVRLSQGSPFESVEHAETFLKYKPAGIAVGAGMANVVRIVRDEAAWRSRLVHVSHADWVFLADKDAQPEICYEVEPIEYQWDRGDVIRLDADR